MKELRVTCEMYFQNIKYPDKTSKPAKSDGRPISFTNIKRETKPDVRGLTCYNCNELGHLSSQCPKPPRRKRCRDCQRVHPKGEPENCGKSISVKRVEVKQIPKTFQKAVRVKGKDYVAYFDTGSECHMIRRSTFEKLGLEPTRFFGKMSGLWGGGCLVKESVTVVIAIDEVELQLTLYIVSEDTLPTDLLLGCEVFLNENVETRIASGEMKFAQTPLPTKKCNKTWIVEKPPITADKIQTGDVAEDELIQLLQIVNEHRVVFADGLPDLGKTDIVEMEICLSVTQPISQRPYRVPEPKKQIVAGMIKELLENDIIEKSTANYASPMLLVKKKER